jgi:rhamnosyltransferase
MVTRKWFTRIGSLAGSSPSAGSNQVVRRALGKRPARVGVAFFYDRDGVVDDYMIFLLREMRKSTERLLFVSNGGIDAEGEAAIRAAGCEILIRENAGFDVGAYKHALRNLGFAELARYDELLLFNHTFYGPLFPFEEMFAAMEERDCDFWGITSHKEAASPFPGLETLPWHIQSHFIAVRGSLLRSTHFERYWETMPEIDGYEASIIHHESQFSQHFTSLGFSGSVYIDDRNYGSIHPLFDNVDEVIANRCPIIKRRTFFHDYLYHEENAVDLPRALRTIRDSSSYDMVLIWKNILRETDLRTLNANAALTSIYPDVRLAASKGPPIVGKVAVCAHVYHVDMIEHLLALSGNIPGRIDFIATTDTLEKARTIRRAAKDGKNIETLIVRVLERNQGRDMGAMFVACRDLFADDRYALVCRLHTKKSPQDGAARANIFRHHVEENLLNSVGYVTNVFDMFVERPWIGVAIPPIIHIGYPTLGHAWYLNRPEVERVARLLDIRAKFDADTPVAPYGGMYWFRPRALRKLFQHPWSWDDFPPEPDYCDGDLPHALERLIAYAAQDAGYTTQHIICKHLAEQNYVSLEYKLQKLASTSAGTFREQYHQALHSMDDTAWNFQAREADKRLLASTRAHLVNRAFAPSYAKHAASKERTRFYRRLGLKASGLRLLGRAADDPFPLFDPLHYMLVNPDVVGEGIDPLTHYVRHGVIEGRDPNALFSVKYYRDRHLGDRGRDDPYLPLVDYLGRGAAALYSPHPLFDPEHYSAQLPEGLELGDTALDHFLREGALRGLNPVQGFDTKFYVSQCTDVDFTQINPLVHYLLFGGFEGRDPNPGFSSNKYLARNPDVLRARMNPLLHYIQSGASEGRGC